MDRLTGVDDIWRKWGDDLLAYAAMLVGPDDAADVVSNVITRRLDSDQSDRPVERSYLFRSILNEVRGQYRSRTRRERREWRATELPDHVELLADPDVRAAVARLSPMQRAVVFLTYWDDMPAAEVADALGVATGTVKAHLARARTALRKVLR